MGTADAVFQNIDIIESYAPEYMVILAGDHIYKMDYELMLQQHVDAGADVTVGCLEVPRVEATGFGVMHVDGKDRDHHLPREAERPARHARTSRTWRSPPWASTSSRPSSCSTSCAATPPTRTRAAISARTSSPTWSSTARRWRTASPSPASARSIEAEAYWRDVGTVDAYWEANIDLTDMVPELDLYDRDWPIWTYAEITPPAKFVHDEDGRRGMAVCSLVSGGCIISGASLRRSLLFTGVRVNSYSALEDAVVLPYVDIGRDAQPEARRHRPRRAHPRRPGRRRGPATRRSAASAAPRTASA